MADNNLVEESRPVVDPFYGKGTYFSDTHRHSEDAKFKADGFLKLFVPLAQRCGWDITSYADVGCGSGDLVRQVSGGLREAGFALSVVRAYDVSPHVTELVADSIEYVHADFCTTKEQVDLVTLFDVFEHVASPVEFLKNVASHTNIIVLHIPLDNSLNNALRDRYRRLLRQPGHLVFLDTVNALNLCSYAGLTVVTYEYTFGFRAPSGHRSLLAKAVFPLRALLSRISPWLLSKTVGGASLLVVARTPVSIQKERWSISRRD